MGGFASPSIIKPAPVCPPRGSQVTIFGATSLELHACFQILFLGLPCLAPCLLRMLAGYLWWLVRWLQPPKAPSQQAQSPHPPKLGGSLGAFLCWCGGSSPRKPPASPQAPVCPPRGSQVTIFGATSLELHACFQILFLGLPCLAPCLLRMLAGYLWWLVRWLQPPKAPSQQAQSPHPPKLGGSLGAFLCWCGGSSPRKPPASPQAPVCPPRGLPIITLIAGISKMVSLAHVRPDLSNQENAYKVAPDMPFRFSLWLASLALALWRKRLRASQKAKKRALV